MKQFNLKEYLANPNRKVVTRDGRPVRIVCTDMKGNQPVLALRQSGICEAESILSFFANGAFAIGRESNLDLFFATEKHQAWLNIYSSDFNLHIDNHLYASKARAEKEGKEREGYVSTGKFEWEE